MSKFAHRKIDIFGGLMGYFGLFSYQIYKFCDLI